MLFSLSMEQITFSFQYFMSIVFCYQRGVSNPTTFKAVTILIFLYSMIMLGVRGHAPGQSFSIFCRGPVSWDCILSP